MRRLTWLLVVGLMLVSLCSVLAQAELEGVVADQEAVLPSWTTGMPVIPVAPRYSELDELNVALIQDIDNWWGDITGVLDVMEDVTYDIINSANVQNTDFSEYVAVVVSGNQDATFYTNLNAAIGVLQEYVEDGGWLEYHGGTNTHTPGWELWDGTGHIYSDNSTVNYIQDEDHPIVLDEPNPEGSSCNHGYLTGYPDDANVIISRNADGTLPTLIEYEYGHGHVIATTMTYAHMWSHDYVGAYLLPNTLDYVIYHPRWGTLMGTVIDIDDEPVAGTEISVWIQEDTSFVANVYTDENGDYILEETLFEMDYIVKAMAPGYFLASEDSVSIASDDTTVVNFILDYNNAIETEISGTVYSADNPDNPVEGITVSIPVLNVSGVTDENGGFNLGSQAVGYYTFVISGDPAGSDGYHDKFMPAVEVSEDEMPLEFEVYEVLPPTAFSMSIGDTELDLVWGAPDNHPEEDVLLIAEEIENLYLSIDDIRSRNIPQEIAKLPLVEKRIHMLQNIHDDMIRAMGNGQELDELMDFQGYRVKLIYPNGMEDILDNVINGESYTVSGLANGTMYGAAVAADYGYGDDYLVFCEPLYGRPLPVASTYIVSESQYDWIEINPNNGGEGSVAVDAGDDANSGEVSLDELTFPYFGDEYDSFGACTNGWFSFTDFTSTSITVNIPATSAPNTVLLPLNGDYHGGAAGDGIGIWYLEDTENDQVIIQFYLRPYSGNTDYRFSYEAVLDCETGAIKFQYEEADDWSYYIRGGVGIENSDGTVAYTYPYQSLENEFAITFQPPDWSWAGINGVVSDSITGDPVVGCEVVATDSEGDTWYAESDENGWYSVLVDSADGPWDVDYEAIGYTSRTVEDITIVEGFDISIDVSLLPAGTISGSILDYSDDDPVEGATVVAESDEGDTWTTTTDEDGYYEFVREFNLDETFSITVSAEGYASGEETDLTFAEAEYFLDVDLELVPMGSIEGTITDVDDNIVENAQVTLTDSDDGRYSTSTDENGWYEFVRILDRDLTYDMEVIANQYNPNTDHTDLEFGEEVYTLTVNVEMEWVSPETPPVLVSDNKYHDDGVYVTVMPPGFVGDLIYLTYDDGTPGNATYLNTNGENYNWGVPFFLDGTATVVQGEIRLTSESEQWTPAPWPDGVHDPIIAMCWANGDDDLPGELLYTSGEITTSADEPWAIFEPGVTAEDVFWLGFYVPPTENTSEAICVDASLNEPQSYLYYTTNGWDTATNHNVNGDPMVRAWVLGFQDDMFMAEHPTLPSRESVPNRDSIIPLNAAVHGSSDKHGFCDGPNPLRPGVFVREGLIANNELDEFDGYFFYVSTDGEEFELYNDDPVTENQIPYLLVYGSDWESDEEGEEGNHVYYYVTAQNTVEGEIIESDPTDDVETWFWMPPDAPSDVSVSDIDHNALTSVITWEVPTENEDGTDLVDLAGFNIYRDNELIATLDDPEAWSYNDQVLTAGYYSYKVEAFDEVPNYSAAGIGTGDEGETLIQIGSAPYWSSFEPGVQPEQDIPFEDGDIWTLGTPTAGPGEAHDGDYCYATYMDGIYNNNDDAIMESEHAWIPAEGAVLLMYYHWYQFESYYDGYNLQVSTNDGGTWTVVSPIDGYNYEGGVSGLDAEPGWSASSNAWAQVTYDLTNYVADADSFLIRFRFGSDGSGNSYYGVAIDELELWGVEGTPRGSIYGFVMDSDDEPVEGVRVYVEEYPAYEAYTDASGYYFLFNSPADDTLNIITEYPCYWPSRADDTELLERDTIEVNFTNASGRALVYPDGDLNTTALEVFVNFNELVGDSIGTTSIQISSVGTGPLDWYSYIWVVDGPHTLAEEETGGKVINAGPQQQRSGRMMRKTTGSSNQSILSNGIAFAKEGSGPIQSMGELDDLFDHLMTFDAQSLTMNPGIYGAVTLEDGIYVSAVYIPNSDIGDNFLYQFSHAGNPIAARTYPGEMISADGMGLLDLAYDVKDGMLYGGNSDGDVFRFAPDLTEYEWVCNLGMWPVALAIDYDDGYLYASDGQDGFVLYDLDTGAQSGMMIDPEVGPIMGLAYNPSDQEGYCLWALATDETGEGGVLHRFSTSEFTWNTNYQVLYEEGVGTAGGMEITRGYHSARYDVTTVMQGETDWVDIWEGTVAPMSWFYLEPSEGVLEPEEVQDISVTVDVRGGKAEELGFVVGDELMAEIVLTGPYWCAPPIVDLVVVFVDDIDDETADMPTTYALHQNYPNPFNPVTQIRFDLVDPQNVNLMVYNVMGQEVMQLANGRLEAGYHTVSFDARNLASGMYFYRIEAGAFTDLKRMVLVK